MSKVSQSTKINFREPGMTPRRLRYTFSALEKLEELANVSTVDVLTQLNNNRIRLRFLRLLIYVGLEAGGTRKDGETLTPELVRSKIEAYVENGGHLQDLTTAVVRALNAAKVLSRPEEKPGKDDAVEAAQKAAQEEAAAEGRPTSGPISLVPASESPGETAGSGSTSSGDSPPQS